MISNRKNPTRKPVITCGIFLYSTRLKKILVCHATHAPWNQWSIPKGLKETSEKSLDVAKRELAEETGLSFEQLHATKLFNLPPVKYKKQNKTLESFLVLTDFDFEGFQYKSNMTSKPGVAEVDSWKWIPLPEVKKWLHESQSENIDQILKLIQEATKENPKRPPIAKN